jgi:hypothetical protein
MVMADDTALIRFRKRAEEFTPYSRIVLATSEFIRFDVKEASYDRGGSLPGLPHGFWIG